MFDTDYNQNIHSLHRQHLFDEMENERKLFGEHYPQPHGSSHGERIKTLQEKVADFKKHAHPFKEKVEKAKPMLKMKAKAIGAGTLKKKLNRKQEIVEPVKVVVEKEYIKQYPVIGGGNVDIEENLDKEMMASGKPVEDTTAEQPKKKYESRADALRDVMKTHKLTLGKASAYIKSHNLYP